MQKLVARTWPGIRVYADEGLRYVRGNRMDGLLRHNVKPSCSIRAYQGSVVLGVVEIDGTNDGRCRDQHLEWEIWQAWTA